MTMTETRPEAAAPPAEGAAPAVRETIFTTGDHKRLGRAQLHAGLLFLLVGAVMMAIARGGVSDLFDLNQADTARYASAETSMLYLLGLPLAWWGLATVLVPLQVGATRLALPRLHAAAFWGTLAGAAVIVAGYLTTTKPNADLLGAVPLPPGGDTDGTELWVLGHLVVAVCMTLFAISLLTTLLTRRAEGMTIPRMPAFSIATLLTAAVTIVATPVFAGGLLLLALDQHFGGRFFYGTGLGGVKAWQHLVFLPGRPEVFLLALPALGALTDVVVTHARRRPLVPAAAGAALTGFAALTLLTWAAGADRLFSVTQPVTTLPLLFLGAPLGLLVLLWLATLKTGRPTPHVSLLGVLLLLGAVGLTTVVAIVAAVVDVAAEDAPVFARSTFTFLVLGSSLVALVAALWHWAPKIWGRQPAPAAGGLALLAAFTGALVAAAPGWFVGFGASNDTLKVAVAGAVLLGLGVLVAALAPMRGAPAADDPYEGSTLEWATTSPPPPHNFDALPEVRSATPLADLREAGATR